MELAVQPYMLKHNCLTVPVAIRSQMVLAPPDPGTKGGGRVEVTYPEGQDSAALWRDPEGRASVLYFKAGLRKWFQKLSVGTLLLLEAVEVSESAYSGLKLGLPAIEEKEEPLENCCLVPVRPDWTDSHGLLGYYNPITEQYVTSRTLRFLLRAGEEAEAARREGRHPLPFFLILDEMNLAKVEQYFSDFLSCLESEDVIDLHQDGTLEEGRSEDGLRIPRAMIIPRNVFLTGTVNVDETTYMFSPKVLDRAFTIELDQVDLGRYGESDVEDPEASVLQLANLPSVLELRGRPEIADWREFGACLDGKLRGLVVELNSLLQEHNRQFGYRVATQIGRFVLTASQQAGSGSEALWTALDLALKQKVLPKFHGTLAELDRPLRDLFAFAVAGGTIDSDGIPDWESWRVVGGHLQAPAEWEGRPRLPRVAGKVWRMLRRLKDQSFTAFIE